MVIGEWQTRMEIGMKSDRPFMMAPAGRLIPNAVTLIYLSNKEHSGAKLGGPAAVYLVVKYGD